MNPIPPTGAGLTAVGHGSPSRAGPPLRPIVPSSGSALRPHPRLQHSAVADGAWDDQAEREARGLVALLFVAGGSLRRAELAAALRVSASRIDRACAFLGASPPHGLALLESGDEIQLVSAPDCGPLVERFLDKPPPEPLSQAALEVLSIVAYEQPVTRADISHISGTDCSGVIETLLARGLIADDPRFGGRGRPRSWLRLPRLSVCSASARWLSFHPRPVAVERTVTEV
jgi:segregation and condensation protein B